MAHVDARNIAKDIMVSWLSNTEQRHSEDAGRYLGKIYQDLVRAVQATLETTFK